MSVNVPFAGTNYPIPETDETGWGELTQFLVALARFAATTTSMVFSTRIATALPLNVQPTDTVLSINVPAGGAVNLPTGVAKRFVFIADVSGNLGANEISVNPSGGQLINGQSAYKIRSDRGAVLLHFNGSQWIVLSEVSNVLAVPNLIENENENATFVQDSAVPKFPGSNVPDNQSCLVTFDSDLIFGTIELQSGASLIFTGSKKAPGISFLSDPENLGLMEDAGVGVFVSKIADSGIVSFKNRLGASSVIRIRSRAGTLSGATAWS